MRLEDAFNWTYSVQVDVLMRGTTKPGRRKRLGYNGHFGVVQGPGEMPGTQRVRFQLIDVYKDLARLAGPQWHPAEMRELTRDEKANIGLCFENMVLVSPGGE